MYIQLCYLRFLLFCSCYSIITLLRCNNYFPYVFHEIMIRANSEHKISCSVNYKSFENIKAIIKKIYTKNNLLSITVVTSS